MSLIHVFKIEDSNECVQVEDFVMLYMQDSIDWIESEWDGINKKSGLDYYGYSKIDVANIKRLIKIIGAWKSLFENSDENIQLTGMFIIDEGRYEKKSVKKVSLLKKLSDLIVLFEKAVTLGKNILYEGI
ncbi:MAG: hypothetical protein K6F39_03725 [Lachnospiraceae bacterium]|nr:hypothetical protein [Lachnospiraceae bacterium]